MPYCQNCGAEVNGNFCPNCGRESGSHAPELVIHKNVDVKPRYNVWVTLLAGWLGWCGIYMIIIGFAATGFFMNSQEYTFGMSLIPLIFVPIGAVITYLCYLPGIKMIRKRTPKELVGKTIKSYVIRSLLFIICWGISIAGVFYIIGIPLKSWRLGLWASRPKFEEYTAFFNGEMIPVTKYYDDLPDYAPKGEYVYMDANGVFYRPPVN